MHNPIHDYTAEQLTNLCRVAEHQAADDTSEAHHLQKRADKHAADALKAAWYAADIRRILAYGRDEPVIEAAPPAGPSRREMAARALLHFVTDPRYTGLPAVEWIVTGDGRLTAFLHTDVADTAQEWAAALDTVPENSDHGKQTTVTVTTSVHGAEVEIWGTVPAA